jgi:hypothetical protein
VREVASGHQSVLVDCAGTKRGDGKMVEGSDEA